MSIKVFGAVGWIRRTKYVHIFPKNKNNSILDGDISYSDSLDKVLNLAIQRKGSFDISEIGYETLKNIGVDIISNETLKKGINILFEETFPRLMDVFMTWGTIGEQP